MPSRSAASAAGDRSGPSSSGWRPSVTVHFIGAGPGAPDLLTLRARDLIAAQPGLPVRRRARARGDPRPRARRRARSSTPRTSTLDEIVGELERAPRASGEDVARLHSGDLSIYSAAAEQMRRLDALGIPWDVTPGVPAFAAAAAALRRELTIPEVAQTVILTRYGRRASPMPPGEELADLAAHGATLVIHLGVQAIDEIAARPDPHYGADCPAAVVARASWPDEVVLRARCATSRTTSSAAGVRRTADDRRRTGPGRGGLSRQPPLLGRDARSRRAAGRCP